MNDEQLLRYSRQIMLPEFDIAGQQALLDATALVVGLGGLGAPVALYLAAAGVGRLHLVDHDTVDISNLQRQVIHDQAALGTAKVASAARRVAALNPDTQVRTTAGKLGAEELAKAAAEADVVLDGTDNFASRDAVNTACVAARVPLVSGAAIRMEGQIAVFDSRLAHSPCYRCLYGEAREDPHGEAREVSPNCTENGIVAPLVGIVGSVQAMEAVKLIAGVGEPLVGHVLYLDAKRMEWRKLGLARNPGCPTCGP